MVTRNKVFQSGMTRREFVALGAAGCACALCPGAAVAASTKPVRVGSLADFRAPGVTSTWVASHGFFVVHERGRLYAVVSRCTHKGGRLEFRYRDDGSVLHCSRHGSRFDLAGRVIRGPARRYLGRLALSLDDGGQVVVDPDRVFVEADWDDPASFIEMGKDGK